MPNSIAGLRTVILILSLLVSTISLGQGWGGTGEAGIVRASGNTNSENFNIAFNLSHEGSIWDHDFSVGLFQASADGKNSADNFSSEYRAKRNLSDRRFLFAGLHYFDDDFDGFTKQSSAAVGYGYRFVMDDPNLWEASIGFGYRDTAQAVRRADGTQLEGEDVSGATLVLGSKFVRQLTANTQFIDDFRADIGAENTYVENDASLLVAMNDAFSLKAGILIRYNSDPAPGTDETDTITTLNLVYNFTR